MSSATTSALPGLCYTGIGAITGLLLGASRRELAVIVHDRAARPGSTLAAGVEALNAVADDLAGELMLQPLGWR
jgi:hypothetical protein